MPKNLPLFEGVNDVDLYTALRRFDAHEVEAGDELVSQGKAARGLFVVKAGRLEVRIGGVVVGTAGAGDLVGEMALFQDGARTATVVAQEPSEILVLDRTGYEGLRDTMHPVAQKIEAHTIALQVQRLRSVGERIADLAQGTVLDTEPPGATFFESVRAQFGRAGIFSQEGVDPLGTMQNSPLFQGAAPAALEQIAHFFQEHAYPVGSLLCREGEVGTRMFLLEEGDVDVVIATAEGPRHIASLVPGAAFGMVSMAQNGKRMSTCVAQSRVIAHELDLKGWRMLIEHPHGAGSAFRRAMIHAFAEQLAYANTQLADFELSAVSMHKVDELMNAAAGLQGYGAHLD